MANNMHLSIKDRQKFNCTRSVGVEWEYNTVGYTGGALNNWLIKWHGHHYTDGSCGYEAVTPPMAGDNIAKCLGELYNIFKQGCAKIDDQCGLHVHVDARDLSWHDIRRLVRVYSKIEPLLYLLGGQYRATNDYCSPCGAQYLNYLSMAEESKLSFKDAILLTALGFLTNKLDIGSTAVQAQKKMWRRISKKSGGRYRGLNLVPWLSGRLVKAPDTTIEFRLHRNARSAERAIGWAQLCARIVDYVAKSNDNDVENLPKSSLQSLCKVIAPDCAPWILKRLKEWRMATSFSNPVEDRINRRIHFKNGVCSF